MRILENCKPERVFYYFEEICGIPHGSGNTKGISDYLVGFARARGLAFVQDEMNNVVIYKPASVGYENAPTVILQGHMDMVCEKKPESEHDFSRDGLKLLVSDGYVSADGTTLGGDDGIALAYGLALLESEELSHPPLEVVFTVDEEIGLLGADGLDCSLLKGRRMINLDSESEDCMWVSCAGGMSVVSHIPMQRMEAEGDKVRIRIFGLLGGHSGAEIDKKRASACMLLGRFLYELQKSADYEIISLSGGSKDNAIPREAECELLLRPGMMENAAGFAAQFQKNLREEYLGSDEGITVELFSEGMAQAQVLHPISREKVLFYLVQIPNGIQKMSGTIENLVETSTNLGILRLDQDELFASSGVRSSVETARDALGDRIVYLTEFLGGECRISGAYPAWEYRGNSPLRDKMAAVYQEMYGCSLKTAAVHAGLECGIFYKRLEGLDCVSLGPNMLDIHTPEEKLEIASVERVWNYLVKVLEELKE